MTIKITLNFFLEKLDKNMNMNTWTSEHNFKWYKVEQVKRVRDNAYKNFPHSLLPIKLFIEKTYRPPIHSRKFKAKRPMKLHISWEMAMGHCTTIFYVYYYYYLLLITSSFVEVLRNNDTTSAYIFIKRHSLLRNFILFIILIIW